MKFDSQKEQEFFSTPSRLPVGVGISFDDAKREILISIWCGGPKR
jgi:hypothetical protein